MKAIIVAAHAVALLSWVATRSAVAQTPATPPPPTEPLRHRDRNRGILDRAISESRRRVHDPELTTAFP